MDSRIKSMEKFPFREIVGDPFLARMHHLDEYPEGNGAQGVPPEMLKDRELGEDFDFSRDWKMYYGKEVPGFPVHPHRGFETVTIVLQGYVDHSDSSGLAGRYSAGDVQWMTAGKGMQHAEMFPLVHDDQKNTVELFQVWLNLPAKSKFAEPCYKMLWDEEIPTVIDENEHGAKAYVNVIAGSYKGTLSLSPNPESWAYDRNHHVGMLTVKMEPGASMSLPEVSSNLNRNLFFYQGERIWVNDTLVEGLHSLKLAGDEAFTIVNGDKEGYLLVLEGEPIGEPVVNYGPFVMNTMEEIERAYKDYQLTQFGGWPWDDPGPVHEKEGGRFARYGEDQVERP